jgi:hypothetical protein
MRTKLDITSHDTPCLTMADYFASGARGLVRYFISVNCVDSDSVSKLAVR